MTKKCSKCKANKELGAFNKRNSRKSGLDSWCRECVSSHSKTTYLSNEEKRIKNKDRALQRKYSITLEEYESLAKSQNFRCKSCNEEETKLNSHKTSIRPLAVDHDHKTSKIRGLLCGKCNQALGLLDDNPLKIKALLVYLEEQKLIPT